MNFVPPAPLTPCIKICVVDPLSGLCIGCGRTVAEISALAGTGGGSAARDHVGACRALGGGALARGARRARRAGRGPACANAMILIVPLVVLVAALVALLATPAATPILGLDHGSFARVAFGAALLLWLALAGARRAGPGGPRARN